MERKRFLVRSTGDNLEGTKVGLAKFLELIGSDKNGVIVAPKLSGLESTLLVPALGQDVANRLIKNRTLAFSSGNRIDLCSQQTLRNFTRADVYLALWASEYMIEAIEALSCWSNLVVVTWSPTDAQRWSASHEVQTIYDDDGRHE